MTEPIGASVLIARYPTKMQAIHRAKDYAAWRFAEYRHCGMPVKPGIEVWDATLI
jgi:hypothetical protein